MARLAKYTESILVNTTASGLVAAEGAEVSIYYPDTTTDVPMYSDSNGTVSVTPPIVLGADGLLQFYVRSQDRTFDIKIVAGASPYPQFTTFTLPDVSATYDDSVFYASEYSTLQAAVTAMTAGSKLIVDEDFTLSATLTVDMDDIVIEGFNRGIRIRAGTNLNDNLIEVEGNRITIRNLEIDGNDSNQSGAGPYYGIKFTDASGDCLIEDIYVHGVKGDGIQVNGTSWTTFRRIMSQANQGYGFSYDATVVGNDNTFDDCVAAANGIAAGLARRDGFNFTPPFTGLTMINCRADSNFAHGIHIAGRATSETYKFIRLIGCNANNNGVAGPAYAGLKVVSNSNGGTIIRDLEITGGHYSVNSLYGIYFEASESVTNPGTASVIRNFHINGVTIAENGGTGLYLQGRLSYGQVSNPILYNNCAAVNGSGITLLGASASNALADFGDEGRVRWVVIDNPIISRDASTGTHEYGVNLGAGTKYCVVKDLIAVGMQTAPYSWVDAGKGNLVTTVSGASAGLGLGGGGGFPSMALHTDTSYGVGGGKFWLTGRTRTVSTTETRVGTHRASSRTRVLSLVPLDITAASQMMSGGGWFQDLTNTVSGSATAASGGATANMGYITIKNVAAATNYTTTGEFMILCADSITGI